MHINMMKDQLTNADFGTRSAASAFKISAASKCKVSYSYDANGNITRQERKADGNPLNEFSSFYKYSNNRLIALAATENGPATSTFG